MKKELNKIALFPAHPSQVWILREIEKSLSDKYDFIWFIRDKDICLELADRLGIKYEIIDIVGIELTVIVLLYLYSIYFKSIPLFGNLLISILVSLSFLLVIYIELVANSENQISFF